MPEREDDGLGELGGEGDVNRSGLFFSTKSRHVIPSRLTEGTFVANVRSKVTLRNE